MISTIYSIGNEVLFYTTERTSAMSEMYARLASGELQAIDLDGNAIPSNVASAMWDEVYSRVIGPTKLNKIKANIELYPVILAIVMCEISDANPEPPSIPLMQKLSPVLTAISIGAFADGAYLLSVTETDEFLTTERITKWTNLLVSSDARST
jgi:hypothetical protein